MMVMKWQKKTVRTKYEIMWIWEKRKSAANRVFVGRGLFYFVVFRVFFAVIVRATHSITLTLSLCCLCLLWLNYCVNFSTFCSCVCDVHACILRCFFNLSCVCVWFFRVNYDRQMNMISCIKCMWLTRLRTSSSASHDSAVKFCSRKFKTGRLEFEFKSNVSKCFMIDSIGCALCRLQDSR